jgi:hypothetical protein
MNCDKCGGHAYPWQGGAHKCPGDFTRLRYVDNQGWTQVPEPHDMVEWLQDYDATRNQQHNYPSFAWPE